MLDDFLFQDGFEDAAKSLVRHILMQLKKKGASLAGCLMLEHTQEYQFLKSWDLSVPKEVRTTTFSIVGSQI